MTDQQEPKTDQQESKTDQQESKTDQQEPKTAQQETKTDVGTVKGKWVNIHLLVSPEDPNHLVELKRVLARLTFKAHEDAYCCNKDDLIRLGQRFDPKLRDPAAALQRGSEQFKVSSDNLRKAFTESSWARENILIAIAGSETDGTSGVRDGADATLRQEMEKFATPAG